MAVFRVERTRDYTVMSNHHLKNRALSLKAKGLLSMMLSLPDDWDYTTRGLASICREGVDAIGKTLKELESAGYMERRQLRGKDGRITDTEYTSMSSRASRWIRLSRIRIHQIRKSRIWITRIWKNRIRKIPRN